MTISHFQSGLLIVFLLGLGLSCKPQTPESQSDVLANGEGDLEKRKHEVKKHLEDFLRWFEANRKFASKHITGMIANNPYRSFGMESASSASLSEDMDWNPVEEFKNPGLISSIPVPRDQMEFAALDQSLNAFALGEKPEQKKKTLNGLMKGLYDSLNCHSPIRGIFVYAATDNLKVDKILGATKKFKLFPSNPHWNALTGKLNGFFPGTPFRAIETAIAGGLLFSGGDVILLVKAVGPQFLGFEYLRTVEYSVQNSPKKGIFVGHEMAGIPVPWIPNTRAGFAWNPYDGSVFLYQEYGAIEVGVQIVFSGQKFVNLANPDPKKCSSDSGKH